MKKLYILFLIAAGFLCSSASLSAQGFCGTVEQVAASGPGKFAMRVSLSGTAPFNMGSSNLVLSFNNVGLDNPVLVSSPAIAPPFNSVNVTEPFDPGTGAFVVSINNVYALDGTDGFGFNVGMTDTEFAVIEFDILDTNESSGINWLYNGGATLTVINLSDAMQIFADDVACLLPLLTPLPIELVAFDVTKKGDDNAVVSWRTNSEQNVSHFEVEHSFDGGSTWSKIGMVNATGNTFEAQSYSLEDKNLKRFIASDQFVYYRLKSVDNDQTFQYSKVKNVEIKFGEVAIQVYPNPTTDGVHVSVNMPQRNDNLSAVIKNIQGITIDIVELGNDRLINEYLPLNELTSGTYFISLEGNNKVYSTERIVIID